MMSFPLIPATIPPLNPHTSLVIFLQELIDCQGPPADVGGYYKVDPAKAESAMRPSKKFNELIDNY